MGVFWPVILLNPGNLYLAQYSGCDSVGLPEVQVCCFKNMSWHNLNNDQTGTNYKSTN